MLVLSGLWLRFRCQVPAKAARATIDAALEDGAIACLRRTKALQFRECDLSAEPVWVASLARRTPRWLGLRLRLRLRISSSARGHGSYAFRPRSLDLRGTPHGENTCSIRLVAPPPRGGHGEKGRAAGDRPLRHRPGARGAVMPRRCCSGYTVEGKFALPGELLRLLPRHPLVVLLERDVWVVCVRDPDRPRDLASTSSDVLQKTIRSPPTRLAPRAWSGRDVGRRLRRNQRTNEAY